jgi:transposase
VVYQGASTDRKKMKKKKYPKEFKQQAVDLAKSLNSTSEAARQLGVSHGSIASWRSQLQATSGGASSSRLSSGEAEELKRLRGEVTHLRKVNHILKAAAAFFSQDHLK